VSQKYPFNTIFVRFCDSCLVPRPSGGWCACVMAVVRVSCVWILVQCKYMAYDYDVSQQVSRHRHGYRANTWWAMLF